MEDISLLVEPLTYGDVCLGFQNQGVFFCLIACMQQIPKIHLWCNTYWLLGNQHGSWVAPSMYMWTLLSQKLSLITHQSSENCSQKFNVSFVIQWLVGYFCIGTLLRECSKRQTNKTTVARRSNMYEGWLIK